MRVDYAIVFVTDRKRSVACYRDALGLPLRFETTHWTEFDTQGIRWEGPSAPWTASTDRRESQ
jgi:catechol 2,3-dioxygenase-like lactoylglutathione lyase family enzyme